MLVKVDIFGTDASNRKSNVIFVISYSKDPLNRLFYQKKFENLGADNGQVPIKLAKQNHRIR